MNGEEFLQKYFLPKFAPEASSLRAALGKSHVQPDGKTSRFTKGNALLVDEGHVLIKGYFCPTVSYTEDTPFALLARHLAAWQGQPFVFCLFAQALMPPSNLMVTYDKRLVRVCEPRGVFDVNWARITDTAVPDMSLNDYERRLRKEVAKW